LETPVIELFVTPVMRVVREGTRGGKLLDDVVLLVNLTLRRERALYCVVARLKIASSSFVKLG
jgi:hypothetical protein